MDKKSKIFFWVLGILILASIGVTYWRIMLKRDYIIEAEADCDPTTETCFVYKCDPQTEECTGNPDEDTSFYKLIKKNASKVPTCNPQDEDCPPLACEEGEKDCEEVLCTEQTKTPEDVCNDPVQYNLENPAEEEGEEGEGEEVDADECEEGDEACEAEAEEVDSESPVETIEVGQDDGVESPAAAAAK
jgi:hypothetical protein